VISLLVQWLTERIGCKKARMQMIQTEIRHLRARGRQYIF
jgi:hypothetical protein